MTFDLDGFDDPAHGRQQLTLFLGYYGQNQYFPLIITNTETGLTVSVSLRHGTAHASLGADEDLEIIITKLRERWPDVDIEVRADSGFGVPVMYAVCERLNVWYTFGYSMNCRLQAESEALLKKIFQKCANFMPPNPRPPAFHKGSAIERQRPEKAVPLPVHQSHPVIRFCPTGYSGP